MTGRPLLFVAAASLIAAAPAAAQVTLTVGVDPVSHYVWRGFDMLDGGGAVQPWATVELAHSGVSLGIWSSFGVLQRDRLVGGVPRSELDELDLSLNFARDAGPLSLAAGAIHYSYFGIDGYPDKGSTTHEVYVGAGLNQLPFAPSLTAFYDFNLGDGLYLSLAGEEDLPVGIPLNLSLSVGYMDQSWRPEAGISDASVGLTLPFTVGNVEVSPLVAFTHSPAVGDWNSTNTVWGGVSISASAFPLFR
jgi:uncharacterized protein (TIGR02001 family)